MPRQTLINSLFTKESDGSLTLNTDGQEWQSFKGQFAERSDPNKVEGEPKLVFLYKHSHGDEQGLNRAIEAGEVKDNRQRWHEVPVLPHLHCEEQDRH